MSFNFPDSWGPFPGAQFPYTQTGALNMDWILCTMKKMYGTAQAISKNIAGLFNAYIQTDEFRKLVASTTQPVYNAQTKNIKFGTVSITGEIHLYDPIDEQIKIMMEDENNA